MTFYKPSPDRWIACEIVSYAFVGRVVIRFLTPNHVEEFGETMEVKREELVG